MSDQLKALLAQQAALEQQIAEARRKAKTDAVATVRAIVAENGLTADDVFPAGRARSAPAGHAKVAPKYRDPATGQTWTGRGKPPKWIQGQDRAAFAI
ncbi:MAG: H-NS histone family protein [Acidovorax sp.]